MTDKRFLILTIVVTVVIFVGFTALVFILRPDGQKIKPVTDTTVAPLQVQASPNVDNQAIALVKLESQVQQLKDMVSTYGQFSIQLQKSFTEEKEKTIDVREKAVDLQEKLREAITQKESLEQEVTKIKADLELTQPLKQKLVEIEKALKGLDLSPDKQNQLVTQLESLGKELDSINQQIPSSISENKAYKIQVQTLSQFLSKKEDELASLKQKVTEEQSKSHSLANNLNNISEQLSKISTEKVLLEKNVEALKSAVPVSHVELKKLEKELKDSREREAKLVQEKQQALKDAQAAQEELKKQEKELKDSKEMENKLLKEKEQVVKEAQEQKDSLVLLNKKNLELEKEMSVLKSKFEKLGKEYSSLKDVHDTTQLAVKQSEAELGKRKEEITFLKERLDDAEAKTFEIYSKFKELKKDSANLREQNVNGHLEKEGLREELNQAKVRLSELQSKFQQIGSMINTTEDVSGVSSKGNVSLDSSKKVEVELLPQAQVQPQAQTVVKDEK